MSHVTHWGLLETKLWLNLRRDLILYQFDINLDSDELLKQIIHGIVNSPNRHLI